MNIHYSKRVTHNLRDCDVDDGIDDAIVAAAAAFRGRIKRAALVCGAVIVGVVVGVVVVAACLRFKWAVGCTGMEGVVLWLVRANVGADNGTAPFPRKSHTYTTVLTHATTHPTHTYQSVWASAFRRGWGATAIHILY